MKVVVVHPFGNANVRAVLRALCDASLLDQFITSLGYSSASVDRLPAALRNVSSRRAFDIPADRISAAPLRELVRLIAPRIGLKALTAHERGWASIDAVWSVVDRYAARYVSSRSAAAVYAYEDCAHDVFLAARDCGARRVYDLPIAFWETSRALLAQEAERYPAWEPTLVGTRDSGEKLARKTRELELAELVICPSNFVAESLPPAFRSIARVIPFGSPAGVGVAAATRDEKTLRVLFAGAMTQRKGLADVFAAMKLLDRRDVQLVVMGSLLQPLDWYRRQYAHFAYERPRPHHEVLALMASSDVLVLPSLVEGRALVQQEAMACALPVIATRNAGADDVIIDGKTGFIVPIRSPEALAQKISWCADNRAALTGMGLAARNAARELSWQKYGATVIEQVRGLIEP